MIMSSTPRPAPTLDSASAAHDASLVTLTVRCNRLLRRAAASNCTTPGRCGDDVSTPSTVIDPGSPTPTVSTDATSAPSPVTSSATVGDELFLPLRRRTPVADDGLTVAVDDDSEALRAADVDAEAEPVQCVPRPRHLRPAQLLAASLAGARSLAPVPNAELNAQASARALSSRIVLRIRTSARRLTNPGNGVASSTAKSYWT